MAVPHVAADEYRALLSAFPSGVTVITALGADGAPHGLTCTSLCSVTLSPPILLACLNVRSGTLDALHAGGGFAVNLLHAQGQRAAEVFSSGTADRFSQIAWKPSQQMGLPWLYEDAFAVAECELSDTRTVGDHVVVFGGVVSVTQSVDVPLLYGLRQFSAWSPTPR